MPAMNGNCPLLPQYQPSEKGPGKRFQGKEQIRSAFHVFRCTELLARAQRRQIGQLISDVEDRDAKIRRRDSRLRTTKNSLAGLERMENEQKGLLKNVKNLERRLEKSARTNTHLAATSILAARDAQTLIRAQRRQPQDLQADVQSERRQIRRLHADIQSQLQDIDQLQKKVNYHWNAYGLVRNNYTSASAKASHFKEKVAFLGSNFRAQRQETDSKQSKHDKQQRKIASLESNLREETDSAQFKHDEQQRKIASLESNLRAQRQETDSAQSKHDEQQRKIASLESNLRAQRQETDSAQSKHDEQQRKIASLESNLRVQREQLDHRLQTIVPQALNIKKLADGYRASYESLGRKTQTTFRQLYSETPG